MPTPPNTDKNWRTLAERAPYWGVLTDDRFLGADLNEAALGAFFDSGVADIRATHAQLQAHCGAPARFGRALDFGCGVGRLLAAAMRARADRHLADLGRTNASVHADIAEAVAAHGPFDWVNSYIVLQHIPPARGLDLIGALAAATAPGGWVSLHVTTGCAAHLQPPRWAPPWRGLRGAALRALGRNGAYRHEGLIHMFSYDLGMVLRRLEDAGLGSFWLTPTDHGGHYGQIIHARKP